MRIEVLSSKHSTLPSKAWSIYRKLLAHRFRLHICWLWGCRHLAVCWWSILTPPEHLGPDTGWLESRRHSALAVSYANTTTIILILTANTYLEWQVSHCFCPIIWFQAIPVVEMLTKEYTHLHRNCKKIAIMLHIQWPVKDGLFIPHRPRDSAIMRWAVMNTLHGGCLPALQSELHR